MAVKTIEYDDKSFLNQNLSIPNTNKVTDDDMNEIKDVVNTNALELSNFLQSQNNCLKFADGTLICFGNVTITPTTSRTAGGLTYYSGSETITFNETFIDANYTIFSSVELANMNRFCQSYVGNISESTAQISLISTGQNEARVVNYLIVGRWKA